MKKYAVIFMLLLAAGATGCTPKIKLFPDAADPLREFTVSGAGKEKVLMIPITGVLSDASRGTITDKPSVVQEVVSQLQLAEKDKEIRAVVLKINSPGGSVTASDILYHEISAFKKRSGVKVVAAMMDVAASGGYYISLPADHILAHPTTLTGSVGVIMLMPKVKELMDKIGMGVDIHKFGKNKDMASPFRPATVEENKLLQDLTDDLGNRFIMLVKTHRKPTGDHLALTATARIFSAGEAKEIGLIDSVGYLSDAFLQAKKLSGLAEDARVVVYRRSEHANDNIYNTATGRSDDLNVSLINLNLLPAAASLAPGFYYLWLPGTGSF
ncbi:MAG: signal peptide peptidase SppA [Thermodesulfobacteriota bacterium]